jgi:rubrerythrin
MGPATKRATEGSLEPPVGASRWERRLFGHLIEHVQLERGLLEEYVAAAEGTRSKALAYLVNLLVDDEIRHHTLFRQLAESLKTTAELQDEDPEVPRMDFDKENRTEVLAITEQLLDREEHDRRELRALRRELRGVTDTTLWGLLVELMQRDTDKHIAILRFAKRQALQADRAARGFGCGAVRQ